MHIEPLSCGEPGTSRLRMCENFANCVICNLSVNSNFQMHLRHMTDVMPKSLLEVELVLA